MTKDSPANSAPGPKRAQASPLPGKVLASILVLAIGLVWAGTAEAIRLKEMASFEGVRVNQIVGYGLVVGLN